MNGVAMGIELLDLEAHLSPREGNTKVRAQLRLDGSLGALSPKSLAKRILVRSISR